jgi:two-component system CheB/CheR fusion protein
MDDPRRAEEAMQDVEAQFRALYRQPAIGIAEIDLSGRILGANARYREIVGYPREELLGLRLQEITHPDDRPGILERFARIAEEPSSCTFESRCVRKDACVVWVRATLSRILEVPGRPARALAVVEDVTGRVRLEALVRRMMDEFADPDGRWDEFMAILAFELRRSLAPMHTALQVMKQSSEHPATLQQAREMMERLIEQMVRLVNDLVDVGRLRRGLVALRKKPVALATIVQQAVEVSRPLLEAHGHELTIELPPGSIPLDADAQRMTQVFSNLLDNAARYTPRVGRIRLTAERRGDSVIVAVRDTGVGIPAHVLPHVFHTFTQVGRLWGQPMGGLGIGLSLVKGLVELHGGSVEARSEGQDRGSEFVVRLPVAARSRDGDAGEAAAATGHRRVLVVDDSYDAADSLATLLGLLGNETQAAHGGLEALEVGAVFHPDVILMDIGMPGLDGHETARRIRKEGWGEAVVLVAMTGWGRDEDRLRTREAGFDFHLVKPIDASVVKAILDGMRPRHYPDQGSAEAGSR